MRPRFLSHRADNPCKAAVNGSSSAILQFSHFLDSFTPNHVYNDSDMCRHITKERLDGPDGLVFALSPLPQIRMVLGPVETLTVRGWKPLPRAESRSRG